MLRVRVLGGLAVEDVDLTRLSSRKARRVLARLAVARGTAVAADALADVVWGDDQPSQPGDQLSVLVSRLRSLLGTQRVTRTPAGYTLIADWLDLTALAELATESRRRLDVGAVAPASAAALAALELLRGPVLPEEPPETPWLEAERAQAIRHAATARLVAAEAALAGGDPWSAAELARRALDAEPYDEAALRTLMSAHAQAGRPALALRAYAEAAARLADELGVDPGTETQALQLRLLRAEPMPAVVAAAALAGRAAELVALTAALETARTGTCQLVLVEGEAGIGKTRLVREFVAAAGGALVLNARGDELAGGLPLQPLLDAIARRPGSDQADDDGPDGGPEPVVDGPLAGLLGGAGPAEPLAVAAFATNPEIGLSLTFAALDTVFTRLAASRPVILAVDDAHWADAATRAWVEHAPRRLVHVALLIIAAQRAGEGQPVRAETALRLGPLDRDGVAAALGLAPDSADVARLHARSGGHPMFLWELSRAGDGELPASIRDAVLGRCERAGPGVAATLRAAAVLGPDVDLELLSAVLDEPVSTLLDHLEEGARRHLLVESSTGFVFAHELVRDSLRTATSAARSGLLHRQVARLLAQRRHADPLVVAYHARLGGDVSLAATALARAGEIAVGRYDFAEAGRLLDEAIALDPRTDLLVRRARIRLRVSDTVGAAADTRAVRERTGPDDPDYATALEVAALVAYVERDFDRCGRLAEEGAAVAADPEVRASCLALAGRVRHAVGDLAGARPRLDFDAPASMAPVVQMWRGFLLVHADEPTRALRLVATDEPSQNRVGYPYAAISRHMVAGYAQALRGEPAAALVEFDAMAATAAKESTKRFAGRDENFRGWILRSVGATGEADDANLRAYHLSSALGLAEPRAHALLDLADGRLRAGDPSAAATWLDRLRAEEDDGYLFQWRSTLRTQLLAGRLDLATGSFVDAAGRFEEVLDTARRLELRRYQVLARLWLAQARHRTGPSSSTVDTISSDVEQLETVAPMEAWWLTADLARVFHVDSWSRLAADRAASLAARAGPYGATLRDHAARRLGR